MEFIEGPCCKQNEIGPTLQYAIVDRILTLKDIFLEFKRAGICYTIDSSVITQENKIFVIDFATIDPRNFEPILD
jgi:hypothetical protein